MNAEKSSPLPPPDVKQCCARLYESDAAKLLLGDSFHPGGLKLTERLGQLLALSPQSRVLDIASGKGTSALFLAETFGCEVVGIDYSAQSVLEANDAAIAKGLNSRVRFQQGDAESLAFADAYFDAVVCECAFCTFPEKSVAARESVRILRPGGRVGLSDLTRTNELPKELDGLLAWIACIADAQPLENYIRYFESANLSVRNVEAHDEVLVEMVHQVQGKLLGAEILAGLRKIDLPGLDLAAAKQTARAALAAVEQGHLGYIIVTAEKP